MSRKNDRELIANLNLDIEFVLTARQRRVDLKKDMPNYLTAVRRYYGEMTKTELAMIMDVDISAVSKAESGQLVFGEDALLRLQQWLISEDEE